MRLISLKWVILLSLVAWLLHGCGTSTGNPPTGGTSQLTMSFAAFSGASAFRAASTVSEVKVCFRRIRLQKDILASNSSDPDSDDIVIDVGEVTLSAAGNPSVTSVSAPQGSYARVDLILDSHCTSGKSVSVKKGHGKSYTSNRSLTLKFTGPFVVESDKAELTLNLQSFVSSLRKVENDDDLKGHAESSEGNGSLKKVND